MRLRNQFDTSTPRKATASLLGSLTAGNRRPSCFDRSRDADDDAHEVINFEGFIWGLLRRPADYMPGILSILGISILISALGALAGARGEKLIPFGPAAV